MLKTASTLLSLSDAEFAKRLETLDKRGPLGGARSRAEIAKAAVGLVDDGTKALHTVLTARAAKTGNQEALKVLRGFEQGDMKRIGQLSSGVSILVSALTILDNPTSTEALEAGVDIVATAGKGTPLAKAKDIYDFGKNAVTVLDKDANRQQRMDAAMGLIGVAGPIGASLKLTYDGLRALGDLYWGATEGLVAAGVFPATKRLTMEARSIGLDVEKLAATARLLDVETDPGQRAALTVIAENQLKAIGKATTQLIRGALAKSDERDDPGNIRIFRERFRDLRRYADATDPEQIMQGAIVAMRNAQWAAENSRLRDPRGGDRHVARRTRSSGARRRPARPRSASARPRRRRRSSTRCSRACPRRIASGSPRCSAGSGDGPQTSAREQLVRQQPAPRREPDPAHRPRSSRPRSSRPREVRRRAGRRPRRPRRGRRRAAAPGSRPPPPAPSPRRAPRRRRAAACGPRRRPGPAPPGSRRAAPRSSAG